MRPILVYGLLCALMASPALAAPETPSGLALQLLDKVCPAIQRGDHDAMVAAAEPLGFSDFMGAWAKSASEADVFFLGGPVSGPAMPACQISVDYATTSTPDLGPLAEAWAKARGLKMKGPAAAKTDEEGQAYTEATWSGAAGRLLIRTYAPDKHRRVNITLEWHAA